MKRAVVKHGRANLGNAERVNKHKSLDVNKRLGINKVRGEYT